MDVEEQILSEVNSAAAITEAPSEPTIETQGDVPEKTIEDIIPEVQKFELPDGREVDAQGLKDEYYKLLPEFTRRSQELAALKQPKQETAPEKAPWEDPNWQPRTWQEVFEAGKQATLREVSPLLQEVEQNKQQREIYSQAQAAIDTELASIKAKDPKINETELFKHANKGFNSLTAAYNDLQERKIMAKTIEQNVLKSIKFREDPIAVSSATSPQDDIPSYQDISKFRNVRDAAAAAFSQLRK